MDCTIVIPNWNGKKFLKICLDSIERQSTGRPHTILVDNHSKDDSLDFLQKHYPWVEVIALDHNTGFAPAVNTGIKASTTPLIALLNNDTELHPDWLKEVMISVQQYPEASFFATKMLDFNQRNIIDSCGNAMCWNGRSYGRGHGEEDLGQYDSKTKVFGACAGAAVYKKELFEKIGYFDQDFTTYLEDVDLDFRAQLAGLDCRFVSKAHVYHLGSATSGKGSAFAFEMMIKNHFHLIYKNYSNKEIRKNFFKLLYAESRLKLAAIRDGHFFNYLRGFYRAIREHSKMQPKRIEIQKSRITNTEDLDTVIEPTFHYKNIRTMTQNGK